MTALLEKVEQSVEELKIIRPFKEVVFDEIEKSGRAQVSLSFPKLKRLHLMVEYGIFGNFVASTVLCNNNTLKQMRVSSDLAPFGAHFNFKLEKIVLDHLLMHNSRDLYWFLLAQSKTLKTLEIFDGLNQKCLELILTSMSRLTSFSTNFYQLASEISNGSHALPVNKGITSVNFTSKLGYGERIPFEILFKALPNIKHFKCEDINDETFNCLSLYAPGLESIDCKFFNITFFPEQEIFPNSREFKAEHMNDDFGLSTGETKFITLFTKAKRKIWKENTDLWRLKLFMIR